MCRIFGFRSVLQSGVHQSLIDADNAIIQQSLRHPDGWGVAYYKMGSPHLIKMDNQAKDCKIFQKVSGLVSSHTVVTHIRKSTIGNNGTLNTHPFQYGPWVFVHNGNIKNFKQVRDALVNLIDKELQRFILGDTDSEVLFYLFLSELKRLNLLELRIKDLPLNQLLTDYISKVETVCGPLVESKGDYDRNYLTFLVTNGYRMIAFQGGQRLLFSTHKKRCPESKSCSHYAPICETEAKKGDKVHHLVVSSENIQNANVWKPLPFGDYVSVDEEMTLSHGRVQLKSFEI